ncbi:family 43 glycosylhydrolase [Alkalitalea saponilacus]|uniref:Glycosyl hydrolases family 43 n=2 Tax=Alkalitalea saponilacus TaxID=889453 RepID=A0A1T5EUC7_9BACT|nr:family 43 glycosylhydrolase [Alkalitalea saponilacus]ASB48027.1 glycosyl hydrolase [Alkalitalea saponilacus]SKB87547.1 Glycosyl hydrolases family 43 [Alkalitalea saponilacus]
MNLKSLFLNILIFIMTLIVVSCQSSTEHCGEPAPKPLFRDPVYDGAADPVIVWNHDEEKWFMFYTNRRAKDISLDGFEWVHGTRIGIAESYDGANWSYRDTANINYRMPDYTHWAPEVIEHDGLYHMYLTYVPGIFRDWRHPRDIVHLTSKNLLDWDFESVLELASDRVIDACVFQLPDGTWRMWYNNERAGKAMYYADSPDLYNWTDKGRVQIDRARGGEGPKVFEWKGQYWMITDVWSGLALYKSDDLLNWTNIPGNLVEEPGIGEDDKVMGGHADILISNDRAYLYYFTHPGRRDGVDPNDLFEQRRSSIQVTELFYENERLVAYRDSVTYVCLVPPVRF